MSPRAWQQRIEDILTCARNIVLHEYFRLDEEILWTAAQEDIPSLIESLEDVLK